MNTETSKQLFARAQQHIPGGVNSPVRAFKAVGGNPLFISKAKGAYLWDVDGNQYIDLINSWGPMILGHAWPGVEDAVTAAVKNSLSFGAPNKLEVEMAELICAMVPGVEKVRMVNSGTEACMSAIRAARGYTGREKIIKFEGCYHGHADSFLIAAGSGAATFGQPDSPGVTKGVALDTLTAPYNDLARVQELVAANPNAIAAIIIEPVAGNMGLVNPQPGFLEGLRQLCTSEGIVLIFDEVMTGFRLSRGGAQELFGITADMVTLGKIIGAGMPVGAYGGRKEIMDCISPQGKVYQAGTLSGNPVAMAAGYALLTELNNTPRYYQLLNQISTSLVNGMGNAFKEAGVTATINQTGSMFTPFFTGNTVTNFSDAKSSDLTFFASFFREMLARGIYMAPSQFEALFVSAALSSADVDTIVTATAESLQAIKATQA